MILRHVEKHRLLRSTHIASLVGGNRKHLLERLKTLFHHRYLDRPRAQLAPYTSGSEPMTYALGPEGARLLGRERTPKGVRSSIFLEHTLAVADVMVSLELATRRREGMRLISWPEILAASPVATQARQRPAQLRAQVSFRGRVEHASAEFDAAFAFEHKDEPGANREFFLLEVDRGTEPVVPGTLGRSSILKKMLVYREVWRQWTNGWRKPDFGFVNFRVLFVTTSRDRVDSMIAANRLVIPEGTGLFLFATEGACGQVATLHDEAKSWDLARSQLLRKGLSAETPAWRKAHAEYRERVAALEAAILTVPWTNGRGETAHLAG